MSRQICFIVLLLFASAVNAAQCVRTDLAGKKWHIYSSNNEAMYCLVTVAKSNNKVSGFCKSSGDFDRGTDVTITGGKLNVSKNCSVSGNIKMTSEGVGQVFGVKEIVIKIVKSKMPGPKKTFTGLFSVDQPGLTRSTFTAVLN